MVILFLWLFCYGCFFCGCGAWALPLQAAAQRHAAERGHYRLLCVDEFLQWCQSLIAVAALFTAIDLYVLCEEPYLVGEAANEGVDLYRILLRIEISPSLFASGAVCSAVQHYRTQAYELGVMHRNLGELH